MFTITDVDISYLKQLLKPKDININKSSNGHLVILGGSNNYRGAVSLSTKAALRSGAGIVDVLSTERVVASMAGKIDEAVYHPLHHNDNDFSIEYDSYNKKIITKQLDKSTGALIGPGLGTSDVINALLRDFIYKYSSDKKSAVFDADALNVIAKHESLFAKMYSETIFTPHIGEMARLLNISIDKLKSDPISYTESYVEKYNVIVVLKDYINHIFIPGIGIFRYNNPNPGLAKGGSGDVLSGIIASIVAQGYSAKEAAIMGVIIHGEAAKKAASHLSPYYMQPGDLITELNSVFRACDR